MSEQVNTGIASAVVAQSRYPSKEVIEKNLSLPYYDRSFAPQHLARRPVGHSTVDFSPLLRLHNCDFLVRFHSARPYNALPAAPLMTVFRYYREYEYGEDCFDYQSTPYGGVSKNKRSLATQYWQPIYSLCRGGKP